MSPSPVDRYLDELFDALSGTGGAGRRALAEAEDHLGAATAEGVAAGLPVPAAEAAAVARFGPPWAIARELRLAHRRPPFGAVLGAAWLVLGVVVAGLGATYLAKAVDLVVLDGPSSALGSNVTLGWILLLVGVVVLVLREIARRAGWFPGLGRRAAMWLSAGFALLGLALLVLPATSLGDGLVGRPDPLFGIEPGPGFHHVILAAGVAFLIAAAGVVRHLRRRTA